MLKVSLEVHSDNKADASRILSDLISFTDSKIVEVSELNESPNGFSCEVLVEAIFSSHEEEQ